MFKTCPHCGTAWRARDDLLADPEVRVVGYQLHPRDPMKGFYIFQHDAPGCDTSFAVHAAPFLDLAPPSAHEELIYRGEQCEGHCLRVENLGRCHAPCRGAVFREVLGFLAARPQAGDEAAADPAAPPEGEPDPADEGARRG